MEIQFINITSFRGISVGAVHYYAKVLDTRYFDELLMGTDKLENLCGRSGEEMRYTPTKEEAKAMAVADYPDTDLTLTPEKMELFREIAEGDYLEYGTTRFPSILRIAQEARKRFPNAVLYFMLYGSRKDFQAYLKIMMDKGDKELFKLLVKDAN